MAKVSNIIYLLKTMASNNPKIITNLLKYNDSYDNTVFLMCAINFRKNIC